MGISGREMAFGARGSAEDRGFSDILSLTLLPNALRLSAGVLKDEGAKVTTFGFSRTFAVAAYCLMSGITNFWYLGGAGNGQLGLLYGTNGGETRAVRTRGSRIVLFRLGAGKCFAGGFTVDG